MFADPQSVTIAATPYSLARVGVGPTSGTFSYSDGTVRLLAQHSLGKRIRRVARLEHKKLITDPMVPAQNVNTGFNTYLVVDAPAQVGLYTQTEQKDIVVALLNNLTASTNANLLKLLAGEI